MADVTAADRAAADALGGTWERSRSGACQHVNMTHIHYGAACNACIATALATMRAEGADVVLERDGLLAERYEAIEALTQQRTLKARVAALERLTDELANQRNTLQTRVTALDTALRTLSKAWALSWDCSADPGHRIMNAAFQAQAPGIGGTT